MSSNNNQNDTASFALVFGMVGALMAVFFLMIYALLLFGAFVLTILCIFAWNKERRLGNLVLTPEEARGFVTRGLIGAVLLPCFAVFCELTFGIRIHPEYLRHLVLGGYALGSLGIAMLMSNESETEGRVELLPPASPPSLPMSGSGAAPRTHTGFMPPQPRSWTVDAVDQANEGPGFRFATWDDEEEMRRRAAERQDEDGRPVHRL